MGELEVTHNPNILVALGLGSCVGLSLYDPMKKLGALAHVMLPDSTKARVEGKPYKFADKAIETMLERMMALGSKKENIGAKLVGGANMFPSVHFGDSMGVGEENISAVKKVLKKEGIRVIAEDTGGTCGRSMELCTQTGVVTVKVKL